VVAASLPFCARAGRLAAAGGAHGRFRCRAMMILTMTQEESSRSDQENIVLEA
jgi:hypothetical protein